MSSIDDPSIKWGRRLLSMVTENQDGGDVLSVGVVVGIAATISLVVIIVLCVCGDSNGEAELKKVKTKSSSNNIRQSDNRYDEVQIEEVEIRPKNGIIESNGVTTDPNHLQQARQSQASSCSSQMRPTSLRELPELPPSYSGDDDTCIQPNSRASEIINDDYDHLGREKNVGVRPENYDHITLESPTQISEASPSDPLVESHYAQVNDRTYDTCNDRGAEKYPKLTNQAEPPYNKIKDDKDDVSFSEEQNEPPYNMVKDDPPYNKIQDDDPYNQILDDTYSVPRDEVMEQGQDHYELEPLDPEDPYTMVDNEEPKVNGESMDQASGFSTSSDTFKTPGSMSISKEMMNMINEGFTVTESSTSNDYAVVNKERNPGNNRQQSSQGATAFPCPPEPPRGYRAEEIHNPQSPPPSMSTSGSRRFDGVSAPSLPLPTIPQSAQSRSERQYSKVSARESLASMSARNALNPYEDVVEIENTYATVDGGSGDGVVTHQAVAPPTSFLPPINNRHFVNQPASSQSSNFSETYAEIGASGGTFNSIPSVPIPPSLDSLHSMKKHERRHLATPEDTTLDENTPKSVSPKRSSFSPTTALPVLPGMSTSLHENDVTLEPNYQSVKDSIDDNESENDPNYESVDEARSKLPEPKRQRRHVYEEVSPTNSEPTSPNNVRDRVLNRHTYEDISDVKEKKKNIKGKPKNGKK
ncbi:uncharacterized protein LOC126820408 [Patella vulgata]|uniref:uncharacterized protein LOC126820408 n=1 Tax=Patella vulgata TaxID=6465 RepID=UPI00217F2852|nr:uncharacterized protein LOC126820408 [Patella vulgata]XP_050404289.1 uncharacterized protein LOC126820408 [Patella vulgata]